MKKRYQDGGEIDAMEAANKSEVAQDIADSLKRGAPGTSETVRATPRAMPKAAPKAAVKETPKEAPKAAPKAAEAPVDETKLSLSDRFKLSRERARSGSGETDTRSVNQRIREKFGFNKGGSVSSASKRADGIAQRGKTRGTMC